MLTGWNDAWFWNEQAGPLPLSEDEAFPGRRDWLLDTCIAWDELPFDSDQFGLNMVRLDGCRLGDSPDRALELWMARRREEGAHHASTRIDSTCPKSIQLLESTGFRFMDTLATLEWRPRPLPEPQARIREAQPQDREAILDLSETAYSLTRFTADDQLSEEGRRRHIRAWADNNLRGRADRVFVCEEDGRMAGYIECLDRPETDLAVIDLVAVDASCRGRGVGEALVEAFLHHYSPARRILRVGTQGGNKAAMRLYEREGFCTSHLAISLHARLS